MWEILLGLYCGYLLLPSSTSKAIEHFLEGFVVWLSYSFGPELSSLEGGLEVTLVL